MSSELHQKLQDARIDWEEARRIARESRDKKALSEMQQARKALSKAMKRFEEVTRYANTTIQPELKKNEVEAYERLLKIHKALEQEKRESEKKEIFLHMKEIIL